MATKLRHHFKKEKNNEDIENMLFENRRQLVQITGMAILDDNELPKKITDVVCIQEIDLTPIVLDIIPYEEKQLKFTTPLVLTPALDDSQQLYTINYEYLGLNIFTYTRGEIVEDIEDYIVYLWEEYANEDDSRLTLDAIELKNKLLKLIK